MRPGWRAWAPVGVLAVVVLLLGRSVLPFGGAVAQEQDDTGLADTDTERAAPADTEVPAAPPPPMLDLPPIGDDLQPYLPGTRSADLPQAPPVAPADTLVPPTDTEEAEDTERAPVDSDTAGLAGGTRLLYLAVDGVPVDSGSSVVLELQAPDGTRRIERLQVAPP